MFKNWGVGHFALVLTTGIAILMGVVFTLNIQEVRNINELLQKFDKQDDPNDTPLIVPEVESPHAKHVQKLEAEAGITLSRLTKLIVSEEGVKNLPYNDSVGVPTIGVGRSLKTHGISTTELFAIMPDTDLRFLIENTRVEQKRVYMDRLDIASQVFSKPLSDHDIELLLTHDLKETINSAIAVFGKDVWDHIDAVRQEAIIDILFNLGLTHFKTFTKFIDAVKKRDWRTASTELLLSKAARQNYTRYHHVSLVIDTGEEHYFYTKGK